MSKVVESLPAVGLAQNLIKEVKTSIFAFTPHKIHPSPNGLTAVQLRSGLYSGINNIEEVVMTKDTLQKLKVEKQEVAVRIKELDSWIDRRDLPGAELSTQGMQYLGAAIEQLCAMKDYAKHLDERIKLLEG